MLSWTNRVVLPQSEVAMRPARIVAAVVFTAALAVSGCAARGTSHQTAPPVSPGAPADTPTPPTPEPPGTTDPTVAVAARAECAVSPAAGPAGSRITLTCSGFAPSEPVAVTFLAEVVTTTKATAGGEVASSFAVPGGFAGSHYPGRRDIFQAKGHQSGKVAPATFTVTG
jgi:large repetitive protein